MIQTILAQAQGAGGGSPAWLNQALLFGGLIIVFYFFMIRPQQQKQKKAKKFLEELKKGDQVVTIGGMHGKVFQIDDDKITLEVDKGSKLTFEKSSISADYSQKASGK
jgi:preprotein translocase subunit YajC